MQIIEKLAADFLTAKNNEALATEQRVKIEQEIITLLGLPEEGSKTHNAGIYKVVTSQRINRKVDPKKWSIISSGIPEQLRPISIVEEIKIDSKGLRWLKENEQGYYKLMCEAMEETPAKPSVKVEVI